jgi:hypothetical protein
VASECGAHERNRTFDLLLTKEVLYRLSYVSVFSTKQTANINGGAGDGNRTRASSLEGYSSTIELLPRRPTVVGMTCLGIAIDGW